LKYVPYLGSRYVYFIVEVFHVMANRYTVSRFDLKMVKFTLVNVNLGLAWNPKLSILFYPAERRADIEILRYSTNTKRTFSFNQRDLGVKYLYTLSTCVRLGATQLRLDVEFTPSKLGGKLYVGSLTLISFTQTLIGDLKRRKTTCAASIESCFIPASQLSPHSSMYSSLDLS
jgi:hypothetical protein